MRTIIVYLLMGLAAYLSGAIPFGYIVSRLNGVDIRKVGSGNIGATNVFRSVGKGWGILTFACDFLKGLVPVMVLPYVAGFCGGAADPSVPRLACAVCSIAGHNWPVFLKFRGGKGVATSAGALLGVAWMPLVAGLIVWLIVFAASRYVSVASLSAAAAVTACAWLTLREGNMAIPVALTALGALIVLRHRSNIGRLLKGTEHRAEFRGRARPREQG